LIQNVIGGISTVTIYTQLHRVIFLPLCSCTTWSLRTGWLILWTWCCKLSWDILQWVSCRSSSGPPLRTSWYDTFKKHRIVAVQLL